MQLIKPIWATCTNPDCLVDNFIVDTDPSLCEYCLSPLVYSINVDNILSKGEHNVTD